MSEEKLRSGRDDETQALAVMRAEQELMRDFQRLKQKVRHSPPASAPDIHPVSAPPKVHLPVLCFGDIIEDQATPKRSWDAVSPDGKQAEAHKRQKVEANAPALVEKLGAMLDEMIAKFTDTKSNNKKVVRHVTQGTIDSMQAMKKLQLEIVAALADGHTKGSTTSASQQTTPTLATMNPSAVPENRPRNAAWQQVKAKPRPKKAEVKDTSGDNNGSRATHPAMPRKQRADAIIIKCSAGSYADMLKIVKTEPSLQGLKDNVQGLRRTANGGLLLRMQKNLDPSTQQLQAALKTAISGKAEVAVMQETVQVEIRDLDDMTSADEVTMALFAGEECDVPRDASPRMRKGFGGTQIATVNLRPEHARRAAQDLLSQTAIEQRIDIAILSEPYKAKPEGVWQQSADGGAAIWSCGQPPEHLSQRASRPGYARAKCQATTIYSCYLPPSMHIDAFKDVIQEIAQDARGRSPVIIAGDFNAWSTTWGSTATTQRGTALLDALATLDVCLLNDGGKCTYSKAGRESIIDLTFASPELTRSVYWEVTDLLTYSDHAAIVIKTSHSLPSLPNRQPAYKVGTLNVEELLENMDGNTISGDANTCADEVSARIKTACDAAMESSTRGQGRRPVPWWNQEIATARKESYLRLTISEEEVMSAVASSKISKAPGPDGIPNAALHAVIRANTSLFTELYNKCIGERTFPRIWKQQRLVLIPKPGKLNDDPSSYRPLCMLNTLGKIFERIICSRLEREIEERGALSGHQHGFRKKRSTIDAIREVTQLAANAIEGERWQGGTKQYCLVCTLDVKNAFNSANWSLVLQALQRAGISGYLIKLIADYFKDRVLLYESDAGHQQHQVTGGVPQGSVLGPILWNVMYDGVLRLPLPPGCAVVGFADDIALVTVEKHLTEVSTKCSRAIDILMSWLADNGLSLAEHKTEAVLISSRKIVEKVSFRVGSTTIESTPVIKYLGVMIDHRLNFKTHLEYAAAKASKATAAISRMMANNRGPKQHSRRLIATVVTSTILYAAPIWADAMKTVSYSRQCKSVYRRCALRISSCFCTVSEEAALVVSGTVPIELLAEERRTGNSGSRTQRSDTIARWQVRWNNASTGRWTHRLIPDLVPWIQRRTGQLDFHTTQIITGHGCFKAYLHRFKHEANPYCDYCGSAVIEDAEHVFFACPLFSAERAALEAATNRRLTPENLIRCMLEMPSNWDAVAEMAATVMREMRRREQIRRTEDT
ncbi:uncharacterized protein [Drosophila kikkawai]|uniref:Reverse transcriptase domain-containing protein n=1 Tax=Drosophila kikkawai TaxID=30033 RepID=A0ABM4GQ76_DROKI